MKIVPAKKGTKKKTVADKYDEAMAYLKGHPEKITDAFRYPETHPAGCLFGFLSLTGRYCSSNSTKSGACGCPLQVRCGMNVAYTEHLTRMIRKDRLLPASHDAIRLRHLKRFAFYQRKMDAIRKRRGINVGDQRQV